MSLLGCNSKLLWHEIYTQIIEILWVRKHLAGEYLKCLLHLAQINIQILEVRALKNRTGCETIADFVLMFRELIHMERLETAKVLLQDALVNKKKTEEFFNLIKKIISYEDEMIKLRADFANE